MEIIKSQNDNILKYIKSGKRISVIRALDFFKCLCLSSRIRDLRKKGYEIITERKKNKRNKTITYYYMIKNGWINLRRIHEII